MLGPVLFLLYINDFHNSSTVSNFNIFADDSNLFYTNDSLTNLEKTVNFELNKIFSWLCANKLSLNIDKTNFVLFHPNQKKTMHTVNLHINNKNIKQENFVKYLGIIIDSNLNWHHHVHELLKKIKRSIRIFSKIRHYINLSTHKQLYYSLIYSHLSYGIIIWGNTYTSTLQPLFILQKRVLRIMTFANYDSHSSPIFRQLELLKINDLVFIHTAVYATILLKATPRNF